MEKFEQRKGNNLYNAILLVSLSLLFSCSSQRRDYNHYYYVKQWGNIHTSDYDPSYYDKINYVKSYSKNYRKEFKKNNIKDTDSNSKELYIVDTIELNSPVMVIYKKMIFIVDSVAANKYDFKRLKKDWFINNPHVYFVSQRGWENSTLSSEAKHFPALLEKNNIRKQDIFIYRFNGVKKFLLALVLVNYHKSYQASNYIPYSKLFKDWYEKMSYVKVLYSLDYYALPNMLGNECYQVYYLDDDEPEYIEESD